MIPRDDDQQEPPSLDEIGAGRLYKTGKQWNNRSENTAESKVKGSQSTPWGGSQNSEKFDRVDTPVSSSSKLRAPNLLGVPDQTHSITAIPCGKADD
jgi:hypothetical protein